MEFDTSKFNKLKSNVAGRKSYVYIINKQFTPYDDEDTVSNLYKIGYSSAGFDRMAELKTSLISFKIHRIYIHVGTTKNIIEKRLYNELSENFPKEYKLERLNFKNKIPSEWFRLEKRFEKEFLDFCDEVILEKIFPNSTKILKLFNDRIEEIDNDDTPQIMSEKQLLAERARSLVNDNILKEKKKLLYKKTKEEKEFIKSANILFNFKTSPNLLN